MTQGDQAIPIGGGIRVTVPTQIEAGLFTCELVDPVDALVRSCQLVSADEVLLVLDSSLAARTSSLLKLAPLTNPASTSDRYNSNFVVSTFDAAGITLNSISAKISSLSPALITNENIALDPLS